MPHVLAGLDHDAGEFVPRHVRQFHIRVVPHPAVPIATANTVCFDLYHRAVIMRERVGHVLNFQWLAELLKDCRFHKISRVVVFNATADFAVNVLRNICHRIHSVSNKLIAF